MLLQQLVDPPVREVSPSHRLQVGSIALVVEVEPFQQLRRNLSGDDDDPGRVRDDEVARADDDPPAADRVVDLPRPAMEGADRGGPAGEDREVERQD